jgi:hypothetical protein
MLYYTLIVLRPSIGYNCLQLEKPNIKPDINGYKKEDTALLPRMPVQRRKAQAFLTKFGKRQIYPESIATLWKF